ncbi:unnamed protein product [Leptosia nina]|uniref:Secreted protein n=1 Tax=Leptosia nina TaxID=320188 RepID=A0AAV1IW12_9NEOP
MLVWVQSCLASGGWANSLRPNLQFVCGLRNSLRKTNSFVDFSVNDPDANVVLMQFGHIVFFADISVQVALRFSIFPLRIIGRGEIGGFGCCRFKVCL